MTELVRREVEVEKSPKLAQGSRAVEEVDQCTEQRLQISLQGQQGLGCSICKVRAVQQFQQLATSCGHGELRNAQTMGGGGGSCLRAANSNTNSAKSARVTQPCCQVVLDLSRPPLPTHQCHVSSAWQSLLLTSSELLGAIMRDTSRWPRPASECGIVLSVAEADPIHSLVDSSGGASRPYRPHSPLNTDYSDLPLSSHSGEHNNIFGIVTTRDFPFHCMKCFIISLPYMLAWLALVAPIQAQ